MKKTTSIKPHLIAKRNIEIVDEISTVLYTCSLKRLEQYLAQAQITGERLIENLKEDIDYCFNRDNLTVSAMQKHNKYLTNFLKEVNEFFIDNDNKN